MFRGYVTVVHPLTDVTAAAAPNQSQSAAKHVLYVYCCGSYLIQLTSAISTLDHIQTSPFSACHSRVVKLFDKSSLM